MAAMTGIVGLVVLSSGCYCASRAVLAACGATIRFLPVDRAHATATVAATAAVVVHSLFVNSLLLPFVMQILWVMWGRLAHIRATRRARLGLAVAVPLAFVASCDPCAGTVNCSTAPRVAVTGRIVNHTTGAPVAGVRVMLHVVGAGGAEGDASTTTDAQGVWDASVAAIEEGASVAQITVTSPRMRHIPYPGSPCARRSAVGTRQS